MLLNLVLTASAKEYGAGTIWTLIIILQSFCFVGGIARFIYCMIQISHDEDDAAQNKKRAKHTIIFIVLSVCALQIANVTLSYFGGPALTG